MTASHPHERCRPVNITVNPATSLPMGSLVRGYVGFIPCVYYLLSFVYYFFHELFGRRMRRKGRERETETERQSQRWSNAQDPAPQPWLFGPPWPALNG